MSASVSNLLYKYRKVDANALQILTRRELYFAAPQELNDPLDCQLPVQTLLNQTIASEPDQNLKAILSTLRDMKVSNRATGDVELMHQSFETLPLTTGVLSLSRNPTDALLWSHYADGHRGFCIGFDSSYFDGLLATWQQHGVLGASDVNYADAPIDPFRNLWLQKAKDIAAIRTAPADVKGDAIAVFQESYTRDVIVTVLATKSKDWAYEREYRAVKAKPGVIAFPPNALREIVFGSRSSEADQGKIRTLLGGSEWAHVRFRRPLWNADSFTLDLINC